LESGAPAALAALQRDLQAENPARASALGVPLIDPATLTSTRKSNYWDSPKKGEQSCLQKAFSF
jgi:hypothetical protein